MDAHSNLFFHLVKGDGDSIAKHREFYDEYLAVMDLTAEYYLQTVDTVFVRHALPKGEMTHRGRQSIQPDFAGPRFSLLRASTMTFPASVRLRLRTGCALIFRRS